MAVIMCRVKITRIAFFIGDAGWILNVLGL